MMAFEWKSSFSDSQTGNSGRRTFEIYTVDLLFYMLFLRKHMRLNLHRETKYMAPKFLVSLRTRQKKKMLTLFLTLIHSIFFYTDGIVIQFCCMKSYMIILKIRGYLIVMNSRDDLMRLGRFFESYEK